MGTDGYWIYCADHFTSCVNVKSLCSSPKTNTILTYMSTVLQFENSTCISLCVPKSSSHLGNYHGRQLLTHTVGRCVAVSEAC